MPPSRGYSVADGGSFRARVIEHWKQTATEGIIADLERCDSAEKRLDALLRRGFGHNAVLEIRMRAWADNNDEAARALSHIDRRRRDYIERLLADAGIARPLAATRAQLMYWTYLGAALSRSKLTRERLDRIVAELKLIGLGPLPASVRAPGSSATARICTRRRRLLV